MSKLLLGVCLGALLGAIDGACAYLYDPATHPGVREQIAGIVLGSTFKGLVTGAAAGWVAVKKNSLGLAIGVGLAVGLVFSYVIAAMGDEQGNHYYWEIVLPGALLGVVVGYCSQTFGRPARKAPAGR